MQDRTPRRTAADAQPQTAGREAAVGDAEAGGRLRAGDGAAVHPLHLRSGRIRMQGRSVDEYRAPLFLAWQLTNRCSARCLACCEESGPDKAWRDELVARRGAGPRARASPTPAFPMSPSAAASRSASPHCWEIFELLTPARRRAQARDRRQPHRRRRRRSHRGARRAVRADLGGWRDRGHARARAARIELRARHRARSSGCVARGLAPQLVFVPTRLNLARDRARPTTSRSRWAAARSSPGR